MVGGLGDAKHLVDEWLILELMSFLNDYTNFRGDVTYSKAQGYRLYLSSIVKNTEHDENEDLTER
jgi:hypothetical protein